MSTESREPWMVIQDAAESARDAFWASVARSFPEITTGDMDPWKASQFETLTEEIVRSWVESNANEEEN